MRTKWPNRARTAQTVALAECARACTGYLAALDADRPPDAGRTRLAAALGELLGTEPPRRWERVGPGLYDTLLQTGERALDAGGEPELALAVELADAAIAIRGKSRGAWRLRAHALDGLGRAAEATAAYERQLALGSTREETPVRLAVAREKRDCLGEAVALFPADGETAGAFAAAVAAEEPPEHVRTAFTAHMGERLLRDGAADARVRRLAELYATYCRLLEQSRMADPLLGGAEPVSVGDFRNRIAGRTACVLAGPGRFDAAEEYELVVRCDDFRAGQRADVHAVSHRDTESWHHPAGIRLVFGDPGEEWRQAVRRAVPGAQEALGGVSLRHPLADPALIGESRWGTETTTAFTVLRLLDHLDVSPRLDLFGADRLRAAERGWVADRARERTKTRTALR